MSKGAFLESTKLQTLAISNERRQFLPIKQIRVTEPSSFETYAPNYPPVISCRIKHGTKSKRWRSSIHVTSQTTPSKCRGSECESHTRYISIQHYVSFYVLIKNLINIITGALSTDSQIILRADLHM